ncbi:MAG TPA: GWxTD domain-containing protein [Candidatus Eisenbacteria bacterium]
MPGVVGAPVVRSITGRASRSERNRPIPALLRLLLFGACCLGGVLLVGAPMAWADPPLPDNSPAVLAARRALKANPESKERWLELAHVCWNLGTIEGRRAADEVLEDARRKWPHDSEILLDWADLNRERRFISRSRGLYRRALKEEPGSERALTGLSALAMYDWRRYIRPKSLIEADLRAGQLMAVSPDNADGMALGAFTRLMRGDTTEAMARTEALLARHPDDPRGHFLKLTLDVDAGRWDDAAEHAELALARLTDAAEIEAYRSLENIHWGQEDRRQELPDSLKVRFERNFWKRRDPTPAPVRTERRLEHLRRVFMSDELYGIPETGLRGWDTDPGEAVIRFGMPKARMLGTGVQVSYSFRADRLTTVHNIDGYDYDFNFDDEMLNGNWVEPSGFLTPSLMDKVAAVKEGWMPDPIGGPVLDMVFDAVQFRGKNGWTRVEAIVAAPAVPDTATSWERPIALYTDEWELVAQRGGTLSHAARVKDRQRPDAGWLVDLVPIEVDPGIDSVFIGSELVAGLKMGHGERFDRLLLRQFHDDSLEVSDLMLLDRIDPDLVEGPFARRDGGTVPSPDAIYAIGESVPVYFEAYGLTPDSDGRCRYAVTVEINDLKTFGEWESKRRSALTANRRPRRPRSTSRFEEWSPTPDIERMIDLSVGRLPAGDFWVKIVVEDLVRSRRAQGEGAFRMVPAPKSKHGDKHGKTP